MRRSIFLLPLRRVAAHLAALGGAVLALGAVPVHAQPAGAPSEAVEPQATGPAEADFSKPLGPPDPLNRGTPRGSMYGYIVAARNGDYETAAQFLDLRRLPPERRADGPDLARELKRVLDRTLWVDFATLADSETGFADDGLPAWQDRLGEVATRDGPVTLLLQRVPREDDGVRIWKVSSLTVSQIPDLYAELGPVLLEGFLPPVFQEVSLFGLLLVEWLELLLVALGAWLLARLLTRVVRAILSRFHDPVTAERELNVARHLERPIRAALTILLFSAGHHALGLAIPVEAALGVIERMLLVLVGVSFVFRLIDLGALALHARAERLGNAALIPVLVPGQRLVKVLMLLLGLLGVLGTLGVDITAAVAGLGVGGIAIALAAQKTIENLFGGVTLFADKPVAVGDFCRYGDSVGTVEEIGLRSTRIRSLDRTVVTVPNSEFSNLALENFARRDRMRLWTMIGVRYETSPEQLRFLLTRLREVLVAHPRVTDDPARVRFVGFGACSLDLEVFAYVDTADWGEFLTIREDVYLRFMDVVSEAGTGFAFPSSTTYIGRDEGLDADRTRAAEQQVERWRESGELPFPQFSEAQREEIENSLDWPPRGSAGESTP
ncbi:MAG: mechanosensitive ion channel family protein [Myxococcota bacterium]